MEGSRKPRCKESNLNLDSCVFIFIFNLRNTGDGVEPLNRDDLWKIWGGLNLSSLWEMKVKDA